MQSRDELINKIRKFQDELAVLGVRREYVNFRGASDERLAEELDAFRDQLRQRKKFLEMVDQGG